MLGLRTRLKLSRVAAVVFADDPQVSTTVADLVRGGVRLVVMGGTTPCTAHMVTDLRHAVGYQSAQGAHALVGLHSDVLTEDLAHDNDADLCVIDEAELARTGLKRPYPQALAGVFCSSDASWHRAVEAGADVLIIPPFLAPWALEHAPADVPTSPLWFVWVPSLDAARGLVDQGVTRLMFSADPQLGSEEDSWEAQARAYRDMLPTRDNSFWQVLKGDAGKSEIPEPDGEGADAPGTTAPQPVAPVAMHVDVPEVPEHAAGIAGHASGEAYSDIWPDADESADQSADQCAADDDPNR